MQGFMTSPTFARTIPEMKVQFAAFRPGEQPLFIFNPHPFGYGTMPLLVDRGGEVCEFVRFGPSIATAIVHFVNPPSVEYPVHSMLELVPERWLGRYDVVEIAGEPWTVSDVDTLGRRVKVTQRRYFEGDGHWVPLSQVDRILSQDLRFVRGTFPVFAPPHC
jgi:hypothetical protein